MLRTIDKTENFSEIGGNLALAISIAFLKGFAQEQGKELFEYLMEKVGIKEKPDMPRPLCNVVGGWAGTGTSDIQEFMLLPVHQKSFSDSVMTIADAYHATAKALQTADKSFVFARNNESAWVTVLSYDEVLRILTKIANERLLKLGLDMAASNLWDGKKYVYGMAGQKLSRLEQIYFVEELTRKYPIIYVEDPFNEDDFVSFATLNSNLSGKIVCGDDLYVTNLERLKQGIDFNASNAILIKPNQIGTITDTIKVVQEAKKHKMLTVVSHRSGETEDTLICHLSVGLACDYIKLGLAGERTVKINEMIRIEDRLEGNGS
jgi:enolase